MPAITSEQSRAARSLLGLTQDGAAERASLALATLKRIETPTGISKVRPHNIMRLKLMYERQGLRFTDGGVARQS